MNKVVEGEASNKSWKRRSGPNTEGCGAEGGKNVACVRMALAIAQPRRRVSLCTLQNQLMVWVWIILVSL